MPHFVTLVRYTPQGIAKIKESPSRLAKTRGIGACCHVPWSSTTQEFSHLRLQQLSSRIQLSITEETVKGRVKNILSKLGANDRAQAAMIGLNRGIIEL